MTHHRARLIDVSEPQLYEEVFPHAVPPRIIFDGEIAETLDGETVTIDPRAVQARDIHLTDTTFRDGQQAQPPYTVQEIVELFDLLNRLGGPNGVIRQTEFFLYSDKDRRAVEACLARGYRYPEVTGWIRADAGDLALVARMGLKETGMLTSCSDYHIFLKQRMTRARAFEAYTALVKEALSKGIRPRCHLEDITRADLEGFVIPYVQELMRISDEVDEALKVKVRLCDTMGFGIPFPGAALPRSVPKLVLTLMRRAGVPSERLEWHGHNDFHRVLVNGTVAWLFGCDALNGTLLGIGERTGNPPIEGALMDYIGLKRDPCGIDTTVISEVADWYHRHGIRVAARHPLVGAHAHKTSAGIHAGGLTQDERIYSIFDTQAVLKRPVEVVLTDKSGAEGVHLWVNRFLGLTGKERIKRGRLLPIMEWVKQQYDVEHRTTSISDEELAELVRRHLPEAYEAARRAGRLAE